MNKAQEIINSIKKGFNTFTTAYSGMLKKAEFAITFCQAFLDWQDTFSADVKKEEKSQVAFIRQLVTLPEKKDEYLRDKYYMSAQYLFRVGLTTLKKDAKIALDAGKATEQQKRLAVSPTHNGTKASDNGKGKKIPLAKFFEAVAMCDIELKAFQSALKAVGIDEELLAVASAQYKKAIKAVAEK